MPAATIQQRLVAAFCAAGASVDGPCSITGAVADGPARVIVGFCDGSTINLQNGDAEAFLVGASVLWMINHAVEGFFAVDEQGVACLETRCEATGLEVDDEDIRELRDGRTFFERCARAVRAHRKAIDGLKGEREAEASP